MKRDVVLLLLFDRDGRFLLQHRDSAAPVYPDFWGFFGGGIERGESPIEAFRREIHEELRYSPISSEPILVLGYEDPTTGRSGTKFYYTEVCEEIEKLELHEGDQMGWFNLDQIEDLKTTDMNRSVIRQIVNLRTEQVAAGNLR